jgi:hypothetical protein
MGLMFIPAGYMCVNRKLPLIWQLFLIIRYVIPARGTFVGIIYFHYKQGRKLVTGVPETMRGIGGVYRRVSLSKMAQLLWPVGKRMYCQLKAPLQHQHILQAAVMVIFEPCAGLEIKVKPAEIIGIPSLRQAENLHAGLGKCFRGGREVYDPAL